MRRPLRNAAAVVGLTFLVALALLGLGRLAATLTAHHMANRAATEQALLVSGKPLWHWDLRRPGDLVARRAFGHATVATSANGLRVTSIDGSTFELGLPTARGVDLAHWPWLALGLASDARGQLDVIWQPDMGPACIANAATLPARNLRIDLRRLHWRAAGRGYCELPANAQMLRLRITLPARAGVTVSSARLEADRPFTPQAQFDEVPRDPSQQAAFLSTLAAGANAAPRIELPAGASAEQLLAWRDRIKALRPAAIVVPGNELPRPRVIVGDPMWLGWLAALIYIGALALMAIRRINGYSNHWLELLACLLGPLWQIVGLQWGLHPTAPGLLTFVGALLFAALLQWREASPTWHWIGDITSLKAWMPVATLPAAAALCVLWGHPLEPLIGRRALAYLGWALLQQWLILGIALPRLERGLHGTALPILIAALLFALMHTPNGVLMQLCLVAELWWAWCFTRSRSLLPVAVAHATSALLVGAGLADGVLRSLEVSARFFL